MTRLQAGDTDGAIADCNEAIRLGLRSAEPYNTRGAAKSAKGDEEGALADFGEAIRVEPGDGSAWLNRGMLTYRKGEADGALADLNEAIRLEPENSQALLVRGAIRQGKGEVDAAVADYEAAISHCAPGSPVRRAAEAALAAAKGHAPPVAVLEPPSAEPTWIADADAGRAAVDRGDYAAGRASYEKAIASAGAAAERSPSHRLVLVEAHYNLACILAVLSAGRTGPKAEPHPLAADEAARLREGAFRHLRKAIQLGWTDREQIEGDGDLAPLHDDPRWSDVLGSMK